MDVGLSAAAAAQTQYLTFQLAGEEYAVGILRVREIIEYDTITTVPMAPPFIRGVINLRGSVVPVLDLAVKFGLPPGEVTRRTCIVIVEVDRDEHRAVIGIVADAVSKVLDLGPESIEPTPRMGTRAPTAFLQGMARTDRKFALILNLDRVLADDELAAVGEACEPDSEPEREGEGTGAESTGTEDPAGPAPVIP